MRAWPLAGVTRLAGISTLALLACLAGCATAGSAGGGNESGVTTVSPAATLTPKAPKASSGTSVAATPACGAADLRVSLLGSGAATAAIAAKIGFTNVGAGSCRLAGYPAVTGITAAGGRVNAKHLPTTEFGPTPGGVTTVTLAPHATAVAVVAGNDVAGACARGATPVFRHLLIRPPGGGAGVTISAWLPPLGAYLPDCQSIGVTPVAPAASVPPLGQG